MQSDAARAMTAVVEQVQPLLKAAGFRKGVRTFNRSAEPGLVQVVNFQMGPFHPPGTEEVPGLRPNLYGQFTVNLGVHIAEVQRLEDEESPARREGARQWVNEYECQLRSRCEDFGSDTGWWSLRQPGVGAAITERLATDALAWFGRFATRSRILAELEGAPISSYEISGHVPDRLLAARMRLGAGDRQGAQERFDEWVADCRGRLTAEPHLGGHLDYLATFAAHVGLSMEAPDGAG